MSATWEDHINVCHMRKKTKLSSSTRFLALPIKGLHQRLQRISASTTTSSITPLHPRHLSHLLHYLLTTLPITTTTCNILVPPYLIHYYVLACIRFQLAAFVLDWYQSPANGICVIVVCCFCWWKGFANYYCSGNLPTLCTLFKLNVML